MNLLRNLFNRGLSGLTKVFVVPMIVITNVLKIQVLSDKCVWI